MKKETNRLQDKKMKEVLIKSFSLLIIFAVIIGLSSIYSIMAVRKKAEKVNANAIKELTLDEMNEHATALAENVSVRIDNEMKHVKIASISDAVFNLLLLAGMVVLALKLSAAIIKSIMQPLREIENAMVELSKGNFSVEVTYTSKNEFGNLADRIRETIAKLKKYIGIEEEVLAEIAQMNMNVSIEENFVGDFKAMQDSIEEIIVSMNDMFLKTRRSAEVIDGASEQVSAVAQSLAVSATQQAAALEQTLAGSNQIAEAIQENSGMAEESSASSEELTAQVIELNQMLKRCQIKENIG